jgi:outer membrane protein
MIKKIALTSTALFYVVLSIQTAAAEDLWSIYQLASENDPEIRAAAATRDANLEIRKINRSAYLPALTLSGDVTSNDQEDEITKTTNSFSSSGYNLTLSQAIYNRDAMVAIRQAKAEIAKAEADYQAAQQTLILRTARRYFAVLAAMDNLDFATAEKNAIARQLEQTKQRFNVGLIAITDVHEAQARYDLAVAEEITATNILDNARELLREITGQSHQALLPLTEDTPLPSPDPTDINQWVGTALAQNLQLIAGESSVQIARDQMSRQGGQAHPSLNLVGNHRYSDTSDSTVFGSETTNNSIALQLNWTILQGGGINAATRQAGHGLTLAKENLEQIRRSVERETRNAYQGVVAGISRVKALKQAVVSTQSAVDATEAGLEVGTRTTVDVLDAQQELFRARRDYAKAKYDYILDTLRLKQGGGILNKEDLQQINAWLEQT